MIKTTRQFSCLGNHHLKICSLFRKCLFQIHKTFFSIPIEQATYLQKNLCFYHCVLEKGALLFHLMELYSSFHQFNLLFLFWLLPFWLYYYSVLLDMHQFSVTYWSSPNFSTRNYYFLQLGFLECFVSSFPLYFFPRVLDWFIWEYFSFILLSPFY